MKKNILPAILLLSPLVATTVNTAQVFELKHLEKVL